MLTHLKVLLVASLALALSGCGTMYLAQAAGGQIGVLKARRPID
jgi:predicted aminopeptidase